MNQHPRPFASRTVASARYVNGARQASVQHPANQSPRRSEPSRTGVSDGVISRDITCRSARRRDARGGGKSHSRGQVQASSGPGGCHTRSGTSPLEDLPALSCPSTPTPGGANERVTVRATAWTSAGGRLPTPSGSTRGQVRTGGVHQRKWLEVVPLSPKVSVRFGAALWQGGEDGHLAALITRRSLVRVQPLLLLLGSVARACGVPTGAQLPGPRGRIA